MRNRTVALQVALCVIAGVLGAKAQAQGQGLDRAGVIVPDTTVEHPEDIGKRLHTNHLILYRPALGGSSPSGETPLSLACVYSTWASTLFSSGCPYSSASAPNPSGGAGIIAIVDAYDYPTAAQDFAPVRGPMSQGPGVTGTTAYNFKGRVPAGWDGLILIFEMPMAYRCMFTAWPSYAQIRDAKPRAALYKAIQKSLNGFLKDSWKRSEEKKKHVWTQEGQTTTTEWSGSAGLRVSLTRREKLYKGDPVIPEVTLSISLRR